MLSTTFTIFNATKSLPSRSNLPAWAPNQKTWPQITLLSIACVSLAFCLGIFYAYWRGGHKRAEKAAIYYTVFSVAFFTFSIVMWAIGAAILNESKKNGNGKDMWGWSCKDGKRKDVFQQDVDYALICRLQVRILLIATESIILTRLFSTGRWFVPSSRLSSKSSPSAFTPLSSTAFTPNAGSPNQWICVTKLAQIFIWLNSEVSLRPTHLVSRKLRSLPHFLHTFTMIRSTRRRMANTTMNPLSLLQNTSHFLNQSHSIYSHPPSRYTLPLRLRLKMDLSQRHRCRSMFRQRQVSRRTMQYPYLERMRARFKVQATNHRA